MALAPTTRRPPRTHETAGIQTHHDVVHRINRTRAIGQPMPHHYFSRRGFMRKRDHAVLLMLAFLAPSG
jgi:hypothetical protein